MTYADVPGADGDAGLVRDDVPIDLDIKPIGADRVFNGVLAGSSAIVLVLLVAVVVFLCTYGFPALRHAGFGLVTDQDLVSRQRTISA